MKSRIIADCVADDSPLARLQAHAQRLSRLQRLVALHLPDYLREHVSVANLQNGILSLHCRNSAAAAKLRLMLPRIKDGLWAQGVAVDDIKSRIRAPLDEPRTYRRTAVAVREIGEDCLEGLDALRTSLPSTSPLAAPLARLLEHAARRKKPGA